MTGGNSQSAPAANSNPWQPFQAFNSVYYNNPWGMNMQKCTDNDACTAWVASKMYQGMGSSSGSASGDASSGASSGSEASSGSASSGSSDASSGSGSGSASGSTGGFVYSPTMVGFPAGFQPVRYGMDYDATPQDCLDDTNCSRGLMMYTHGRNMASSITNLFSHISCHPDYNDQDDCLDHDMESLTDMEDNTRPIFEIQPVKETYLNVFECHY